MRIPAQLLFLGSLLVPITHALHESEVGLVDWHKAQIGVPLTHHHGLAPIFHRVDVGRNGSKSVILSATQSNVLAAVDVIDGSVGTLLIDIPWWGVLMSGYVTAWRQVFEKHDPILVFKKHKQGSFTSLFQSKRLFNITTSSCCIPLRSRWFNSATLLSSSRSPPSRKKDSLTIPRKKIRA